ncbi:conserved protein of unknown function [Tenacibaculum sp. 190524A02b]|uniref:Uncharacterized protein n=1 Tax=Tenacibaculum vairaonense TaxID=3137860 RepID=A0ABM9PRY7_9FLAO
MNSLVNNLLSILNSIFNNKSVQPIMVRVENNKKRNRF